MGLRGGLASRNRLRAGAGVPVIAVAQAVAGTVRRGGLPFPRSPCRRLVYCHSLKRSAVWACVGIFYTTWVLGGLHFLKLRIY